MKSSIKSTLHGAAQYRYTEPAPLEVNVFAGKKRQQREELNSDEEEQKYSRIPKKRTRVHANPEPKNEDNQSKPLSKSNTAPAKFVPQSMRNKARGLGAKAGVTEERNF